LSFNNITLNGSSTQIQGPPHSAFTPIAIPNTSGSGSQAMPTTVPIFIPSYQPGVTYAFTQMVGIPQPNTNGQNANTTQTMMQVPSVTQMPIASVQQMQVGSPSNGQAQVVQQVGTPMTISLNQLGSQNMIPASISNGSIMLPNFAFTQQPLSVSPQYYQMFQYPTSKTNSVVIQGDSESEDRKRSRLQRPNQRRVRHTRPKVIEAKGAIQCKGRNRKKSTQCRNAALMEYIGPRPIYCAEHIELDPSSLYEKCKSPYQKEVGDKKGCKEVVLKEFGLCYKHYTDAVAELVRARDIDRALGQHRRISELLDQLEREASAAKKKDGDLYQRKNKLIPKFQEMKKVILKAIEELKPSCTVGDDLVSPFDSPLSAPVLNLSDSESDLSATDASVNDPTSPYNDPDSVKMFETYS